MMSIERLVKIGLSMTDEERESSMKRLLDEYPVKEGIPIAKVSRDENLADIYDEEWIPDKEVTEGLEAMGE